MTEVDFAAIRASVPLSSIVAKHVKLARAGREWKACCPFHEDRRPSFTISDDKGFAHCFGCGWHGDVLDFVQAIERVGLRRAAELIGRPYDQASQPRPKPRRRNDSDTRELAQEIWAQSSAINGTPAETYLRTRGIICRLPVTLRFARLRYGRRGPTHACLVAAVTDSNDCLTGIQRTFLNEAGTGKASVPKPKLSLGRISGGAVRLAPVAGELALCEGIEDALTLQQELGIATWATAGVGNLLTLQLPHCVRSIVIGSDADATGEEGARKAAERFASEGRRTRIIRPLDGHKDFNAELMGADL
jgi:DNA primase